MSCLHCTTGIVNRPRGLCWTCFYTPGVRTQYPPVSNYGNRGLGDGGTPPLPLEPTTAAPGSVAKLLVMRARAKAGEAIFHPQDAQTAEHLVGAFCHGGHHAERLRPMKSPWTTCHGCGRQTLNRGAMCTECLEQQET